VFADPIIHSGIPRQEFVPVPTQWETVHVITAIKENTHDLTAWANETFLILDCASNTTKQWSFSWYKYFFKQVCLPVDFFVFIWNMFRHTFYRAGRRCQASLILILGIEVTLRERNGEDSVITPAPPRFGLGIRLVVYLKVSGIR